MFRKAISFLFKKEIEKIKEEYSSKGFEAGANYVRGTDQVAIKFLPKSPPMKIIHNKIRKI